MGATNGLVCVEAHIAQGSLGCRAPVGSAADSLGVQGLPFTSSRVPGQPFTSSRESDLSFAGSSVQGLPSTGELVQDQTLTALRVQGGALDSSLDSCVPFTDPEASRESGGAHTDSYVFDASGAAYPGATSFTKSLVATTTTSTTPDLTTTTATSTAVATTPSPSNQASTGNDEALANHIDDVESLSNQRQQQQQLGNIPSQSITNTAGDEPTTISLDKLKLPIPMEVFKHGHSGNLLEVACEVNEAFSWNIPEGIGSSDYDTCCGDDLDIDEIDLEAKFLCKVHATLVHGKWLWCCCYYDIDGNYIQKRFDTTITSFDIAKVLALECRRNAEANFHNIWIQRHKRYLEMQSIPQGIPETFSSMLSDIKHVFDPKGCNKCRMDRVQEILFQSLY